MTRSFEILPDRAQSYFADAFGWLSLLLGKEILADSGIVRGSFFSDRIIAGPGVEAVSAGWGRDTVIATTPGAGARYDGGRGADVYVFGAGVAPVRVQVVFDGATIGTGSGDQIVLTDFSADSVITDLGGGVFEVADKDGDVIFLDVMSATGAPVDAQTVTDSLIFAEGTVTDLGGTGGAPRVVIAEDGAGATLSDGAGAATFVIDQTVHGVDAGGGDDVIQMMLDAAPDAPGGTSFGLRAGDGDDVVTLLQESAVLDFALTGDDSFDVIGGGGNDRLTVSLAVENLGRLTIQGDAGGDEITVDLRGSTNGVVRVDGGAGDDTFVVFDNMGPAGPGAVPLDMTTVADLGRDTMIIHTGTPQTAGACRKCFFDADGTDGALLTLVLPDFGDTVEVSTTADGAVLFRDQDSGGLFGCYFCDENTDLTDRKSVV